MNSHPLFESTRATFGADGMAHAHLGPHSAFEHWDINLITITATSALSTSFKLYRAMEAPSNLIDVSRFNGNDDVSDSRIHLHPTQTLLGVWEGGTPGAIATLTVSGIATMGRYSMTERM